MSLKVTLIESTVIVKTIPRTFCFAEGFVGLSPYSLITGLLLSLTLTWLITFSFLPHLLSSVLQNVVVHPTPCWVWFSLSPLSLWESSHSASFTCKVIEPLWMTTPCTGQSVCMWVHWRCVLCVSTFNHFSLTFLCRGMTEGITLLILAVQTGLIELQVIHRAFLLSIILFIVVASILQSMLEIADPIVLALGASRDK